MGGGELADASGRGGGQGEHATLRGLDGDPLGGQEVGEVGGLGGGDAHGVAGGRGDDVGHGTGAEDAAAANDDETIGCLGHLAHEVGGDEDDAPLGCQGAADLANPDDAFGVQTVDGLIEDEDVGVSQEGGGDAQTLPHPEAEPLDPLLGHRGESGHVQDLVHPVDGDAVGHGQLRQVGPGRLRSVQTLGVQQGADGAQRGVEVLVLLAGHGHGAGRRLVQAHDHAHGGGLACAVGAQEAGNGARLDGERDVVYSDLVAVALR